MKRLSIAKLTFVSAIGASLVLGAVSATARPPNGACECAPIDLPVICSNGHIYINPCVASCAHATGCVPYGDPGEIP